MQGFIALVNEKYLCLSVREFLGTRLERRPSLISYAWIATDIIPETRNVQLSSLLSEPETSYKFDHAILCHHGKFEKVFNYQNIYMYTSDSGKITEESLCYNSVFYKKVSFFVVLF